MRFRYAVSVGPSCRAKFHLRRIFGKHHAPSSVFDWQGTPPTAFAAYLAHDFKGMFDREDLVVDEGRVRNSRYGTSFRHAFPPTITYESIDIHYPSARSRHDYLCSHTRQLLRGRGPILFVTSHPVGEAGMATIENAIRSYAPKLSFELLEGPSPDPRTWPHDERAWIGNLDAWNRALAPYHLTGIRRPAAKLARSLKRSLEARFGIEIVNPIRKVAR